MTQDFCVLWNVITVTFLRGRWVENVLKRGKTKQNKKQKSRRIKEHCILRQPFTFLQGSDSAHRDVLLKIPEILAAGGSEVKLFALWIATKMFFS